MKLAITTGLLFLFPFTALLAQNTPPEPEPLRDQMKELLKTEPFNVGVLLETTANFSLEDDNFNGGRGFGLGTARLSAGGRTDQNFSYKLQMDFRSSPSVVDAQMSYHFSDDFQLRTGMQKPFLSADLDPNPGVTDFLNRARLVGAMLNTREVGVTGIGNAGNVNYRLGIYNGTGRSVSNDNKFFYTARAEYKQETDNGGLAVGANLGYNQTENESVGNTGQVSAGDRAIYGAYAKYETDAGWFGTAEFLQTTFDRTSDGQEETVTGYYVTLGNKISDKSEVLVRWDHLQTDVTDTSSELLVFGWTHYATSLVSFKVNALARVGDDIQDDQFGIAGGFQFQF